MIIIIINGICLTDFPPNRQFEDEGTISCDNDSLVTCAKYLLGYSPEAEAEPGSRKCAVEVPVWVVAQSNFTSNRNN